MYFFKFLSLAGTIIFNFRCKITTSNSQNAGVGKKKCKKNAFFFLTAYDYYIFFHFPRVAHYKKKSFPPRSVLPLTGRSGLRLRGRIPLPFHSRLVVFSAATLCRLFHFIQTIFLKGRQMSSVAATFRSLEIRLRASLFIALWAL